MNLLDICYESDNYVVLDLETTNTLFGSALSDDNSLLLSVAKTPTGMRIIHGNEYSVSEIVAKIEEADFLVAHNAKFELQWLVRAGLDLSKVAVFDTMLAEYVIHAGLSVPLGLGVVAERYGFRGKEPYVDICMKGKVCPSLLPKSLLERRCVYDVNVTEAIFLQQRQILRESGKLPVLWTRCILTPVLADVEKNGMCLSPERVESLYKSTVQEFNDIEQQLDAFTGGINLNSTKQRGEFIYDELGISELCDRKGKPIRTSKDGRKTDQDTVLALKGRNKKQREFLTLYARYAFLNGRLTKSLNTYKKVIDDGALLRAQFNQARTRTQRLSSSGLEYSIQFQNQAREFKPLYCARDPSWLIAEIDGAQLEFRVAAFLGQDIGAVRDIEEGFDVHSYTASVLHSIPMQQMLDNKHTKGSEESGWRQDAKADTFKPLTHWRL